MVSMCNIELKMASSSTARPLLKPDGTPRGGRRQRLLAYVVLHFEDDSYEPAVPAAIGYIDVRF